MSTSSRCSEPDAWRQVRHAARAPVDLSRVVRDCLDLARHGSPPESALSYREALLNGSSPKLLGDEDELKAPS